MATRTDKQKQAAAKARQAARQRVPEPPGPVTSPFRDDVGPRPPDPAPTVGMKEAPEAAKLLAWCRAQGFPVTRVKVGEVEVELGMPLPPARPAARTRMEAPTAADAANIYAEYGGAAFDKLRRDIGLDREEDDEDDDEPAIPEERPRGRRR